MRGAIRKLHQQRTEPDRDLDEATTERFATTKTQWIKDPWAFDVPCVDEKLEAGFELQTGLRGTKNRPVYDIEIYADPEDPEMTIEEAQEWLLEGEAPEDIHKELGGIASYLKAFCNRDLKNCYVSAQYVYPAFRNKCLSNIMFRELTKYADREGIQMNLDAQPFELKDIFTPDWADDPLLDATKADTESLVQYYQQFGFNPVGEMKELDEGIWKQYMTRKPQNPKK